MTALSKQQTITKQVIEQWRQRATVIQECIDAESAAAEARIWARQVAITNQLINQYEPTAIEGELPAAMQPDDRSENTTAENSVTEELSAPSIHTLNLRSRLLNIAEASEERNEQAEQDAAVGRRQQAEFARQEESLRENEKRQHQQKLIEKLMAIRGNIESETWLDHVTDTFTLDDLATIIAFEPRSPTQREPVCTPLPFRDTCGRCDYNLTGSRTGICPECGQDNRISV